MSGEASRIANVAVALFPTGAAERAAWRRVEDFSARLFDEVVWIGSNADPVAAIAAVRGERVLVVGASDASFACPEMLLALVAWPESEAVEVVDRAGRALALSIWRRDALLSALRARPDRPGEGVQGRALAAGRFMNESEIQRERVSVARLGLEDAPQALFDGGEGA